MPTQYCNYFQAGRNEFEFVVDFGEYRQEELEPQWHWRMVTSPTFAKELEEILAMTIEGYEQEHGPIKRLVEPDSGEENHD